MIFLEKQSQRKLRGNSALRYSFRNTSNSHASYEKQTDTSLTYEKIGKIFNEITSKNPPQGTLLSRISRQNKFKMLTELTKNSRQSNLNMRQMTNVFKRIFNEVIKNPEDEDSKETMISLIGMITSYDHLGLDFEISESDKDTSESDKETTNTYEFLKATFEYVKKLITNKQYKLEILAALVDVIPQLLYVEENKKIEMVKKIFKIVKTDLTEANSQMKPYSDNKTAKKTIKTANQSTIALWLATTNLAETNPKNKSIAKIKAEIEELLPNMYPQEDDSTKS